MKAGGAAGPLVCRDRRMAARSHRSRSQSHMLLQAQQKLVPLLPILHVPHGHVHRFTSNIEEINKPQSKAGFCRSCMFPMDTCIALQVTSNKPTSHNQKQASADPAHFKLNMALAFLRNASPGFLMFPNLCAQEVIKETNKPLVKAGFWHELPQTDSGIVTPRFCCRGHACPGPWPSKLYTWRYEQRSKGGGRSPFSPFHTGHMDFQGKRCAGREGGIRLRKENAECGEGKLWRGLGKGRGERGGLKKRRGG